MTILKTRMGPAWILYCLTLISMASDASPISLEVTDGRFCYDRGIDNDGLFNNGCGGPSYTFYADNRAAPGNTDFPRRVRAALEYDLSGQTGKSIVSAELSLYFGNASDVTKPGFAAPESELLGYVGDGVVRSSDMLATDHLLTFFPSAQAPISLDVTPFVQNLVLAGDQYAGFTFRIKDDFVPGIFSVAAFVGEIYPGANDNLARTPKLIIKTISEPATFLLFGLGLVVAGRVRKIGD